MSSLSHLRSEKEIPTTLGNLAKFHSAANNVMMNTESASAAAGANAGNAVVSGGEIGGRGEGGYGIELSVNVFVYTPYDVSTTTDKDKEDKYNNHNVGRGILYLPLFGQYNEEDEEKNSDNSLFRG